MFRIWWTKSSRRIKIFYHVAQSTYFQNSYPQRGLKHFFSCHKQRSWGCRVCFFRVDAFGDAHRDVSTFCQTQSIPFFFSFFYPVFLNNYSTINPQLILCTDFEYIAVHVRLPTSIHIYQFYRGVLFHVFLDVRQINIYIYIYVNLRK